MGSDRASATIRRIWLVMKQTLLTSITQIDHRVAG